MWDWCEKEAHSLQSKSLHIIKLFEFQEWNQFQYACVFCCIKVPFDSYLGEERLRRMGTWSGRLLIWFDLCNTCGSEIRPQRSQTRKKKETGIVPRIHNSIQVKGFSLVIWSDGTARDNQNAIRCCIRPHRERKRDQICVTMVYSDMRVKEVSKKF